MPGVRAAAALPSALGPGAEPGSLGGLEGDPVLRCFSSGSSEREEGGREGGSEPGPVIASSFN